MAFHNDNNSSIARASAHHGAQLPLDTSKLLPFQFHWRCEDQYQAALERLWNLLVQGQDLVLTLETPKNAQKNQFCATVVEEFVLLQEMIPMWTREVEDRHFDLYVNREDDYEKAVNEVWDITGVDTDDVDETGKMHSGKALAYL
ncbi:MAG: hypothetical protein Q9166_005974 [cf. Caloplaca sp. 2 TL-2023]